MSELKPCPFCGGSAVETRTDDNGIGWYVFCNDCGLTAGYSMTEEDLVGVWNMRAKDGDDTISRQAAIEAFADWFNGTEYTIMELTFSECRSVIESLPSAQRKKGKWMLKKVRDDGCGNVTYNCVCSECGTSAYEFSQPYCHRCGVPMEVKDD